MSFRVHLAAKMTVSDTVHVGSSPAPGASSHSGIVQWLGLRFLIPPIGVRVPVPEPLRVRGTRSDAWRRRLAERRYSDDTRSFLAGLSLGE